MSLTEPDDTNSDLLSKTDLARTCGHAAYHSLYWQIARVAQ